MEFRMFSYFSNVTLFPALIHIMSSIETRLTQIWQVKKCYTYRLEGIAQKKDVGQLLVACVNLQEL